MVLTFAGIFATQIIDVLNKADVTATVNLDVLIIECLGSTRFNRRNIWDKFCCGNSKGEI